MRNEARAKTCQNSLQPGSPAETMIKINKSSTTVEDDLDKVKL